MCPECFKYEILYFQSEDEWLKFNLGLTQKLFSSKMKFVKLEQGKDNRVEHVYQCQTCNQK